MAPDAHTLDQASAGRAGAGATPRRQPPPPAQPTGDESRGFSTGDEARGLNHY